MIMFLGVARWGKRMKPLLEIQSRGFAITRQQQQAASEDEVVMRRELCAALLVQAPDNVKEAALSSSVKLWTNDDNRHRAVFAQVLKAVAGVDADSALLFLRWARQHHGFVASKSSYTRLVECLARAQRFPEVWEVMEEMDRLAYMIPPALFATVIRCYGSAKMAEDAVQTFRDRMPRFMCKPDCSTYSALISALLQCGQVTRGLAMYHEMQQQLILPTASLCRSILYGLALSAQADAASEFVGHLKASGWKLDALMYNALIRGYLRAARYECACNIFFSSAAGVADAATYNLVLAACCKSGQFEGGFEVFEEMVRRRRCRTSSLNASVIKALVRGLIKSSQASKVLVIYRAVHVDVVTCTCVIQALCKRGSCEQAVELVGLMKKQTKKKASPNVVTYSCLIDGLCKGGRLEAASRVFQEMQAAGCTPNAYTFNSLIDGLCRSGKVEEAFTLLRAMPGRGCEPSMANKNTLMNGICKHIMAVREGREFGKYGQRVFQECVAHSCAAEESALGLLYSCLEYMFGSSEEQQRPDQCSFSIIIHFLCRVQRVYEASRVWKAMKTRVEVVDAVTYNSFLCGLVQLRDVEEAVRLFKEIEKPTLVSHSLVLDGYLKAGDFSRGCEVYEAMVEESSWEMDVVVYNIMLNGLSKVDASAEVGEVCAEMLNSGVLPSLTTYNILIHALCAQGRLHDATQIVERIKERGCTPDTVTYNTVLHSLLKNAHLEEALKLFREMKLHCGYTPATWNIIIDGIYQLRDVPSAEPIFQDLIKHGYFPSYITTYSKFVDRILEVQQQQQQQQEQDTRFRQQQAVLSFGYRRIVDFFLD